jgi:DNA invertase Pin-like site-specific DNA recombinase
MHATGGTTATLPRPRQHAEPVGLTREQLPAEALEFFDILRARDSDPAYSDLPVLDCYARISLNKTDETEKTDTQIVGILRAMVNHRCRLGAILRDDNRSAWQRHGKRPGWDATFARLAAGLVQGAYVVHIDRFLRQPLQLEQLIDAADKGAVIESLYGSYDLKTSLGRYIARQMVTQAAMQSDETSRRQKAAIERKREKGIQHMGMRGFGEESGERAKVKVPAEQVQKEREAIRAAVAAIFSEDAHVTLAGIARSWNEAGLRTEKGHEFDSAKLREILTQGRIAGLVTKDKKVVGRRVGFEPIITETEFRRVEAFFEGRRRGRPYEYNSSPLSGIVVCGKCGVPLYGRVSARKRANGTVLVREYRCPTRTGSKLNSCGALTVQAEALEAAARERVIEVLLTPEWSEAMERQSARISILQQAEETAKARLATMAQKFANDEMSLVAWEAMSPVLHANVRKIQTEFANFVLMGPWQADALTPNIAAETRENLARRWDSGHEAQRAMTRRAFRSIIVKAASSTHTPAAERLEFIPWG